MSHCYVIHTANGPAEDSPHVHVSVAGSWTPTKGMSGLGPLTSGTLPSSGPLPGLWPRDRLPTEQQAAAEESRLTPHLPLPTDRWRAGPQPPAGPQDPCSTSKFRRKSPRNP